MMDATEKLIERLNEAFALDRGAMHAMMCNRVPCNSQFAEKSFADCYQSRVFEGGMFTVDAMGILCGALAVLGLDRIAPDFSEPDASGRKTLLGFRRHAITENRP
jgi:hypothetical protein